VLWLLTPENDTHYHRSKIIEWKGGAKAHMAINGYLAEALEGAARRIGQPEFSNGTYYKDRTPWTPREEFVPVMMSVLGGTDLWSHSGGTPAV
jgi:hypothetical protein